MDMQVAASSYKYLLMELSRVDAGPVPRDQYDAFMAAKTPEARRQFVDALLPDRRALWEQMMKLAVEVISAPGTGKIADARAMAPMLQPSLFGERLAIDGREGVKPSVDQIQAYIQDAIDAKRAAEAVAP